MNDLRLWFVFLAIGMPTVFVLNPSNPIFTANAFTVLPVTTVALITVALTSLMGALRSWRMRPSNTGQIDYRHMRTAARSSALVMLSFAFVMAMQTSIILTPSTMPAWTAPWAFMSLTLVTELMVLMLVEIAADSLRRG
jgi:hypothetical protein